MSIAYKKEGEAPLMGESGFFLGGQLCKFMPGELWCLHMVQRIQVWVPESLFIAFPDSAMCKGSKGQGVCRSRRP